MAITYLNSAVFLYLIISVRSIIVFLACYSVASSVNTAESISTLKSRSPGYIRFSGLSQTSTNSFKESASTSG